MNCKKRLLKLCSFLIMICGLILGLTSCSLDKTKKELEPTITADGVDYCDGDVIDMPENVMFRYNGTERVSSLTLKATVLPESATNKQLTWSLVWADGGSHGSPTSYVTLSPTSDTLSCIVTCKYGFNYQLKVVVSSSQNSNVSASCTLDYEKRISYIDYNSYFVLNYCEGESCKLAYGGEDEDGIENFYVNLADCSVNLGCCTLEQIGMFCCDKRRFSYVGTVDPETKKFYIYGTYQWINYSDGFDDYYPLNGRIQVVNELFLSDICGIEGNGLDYVQDDEEQLIFSSIYRGTLKLSLTIEDELGSSCSINIIYYMD